jgi:hypothetical protein
MRRAYFVCLFLCLSTTSLLAQTNSGTSIHQNAAVVSPIGASQADQKAQAKILDGYGKLPLTFEANHGQTDAQVKFLSRTGGYTLFLSGDEAVFTWSGKKVTKTSAQSLKPTSLAVPNSTAKRAAGEPATGESAAGNPPAGESAAGEPRFVSGYRFSDTASAAKLDAPSGAGQRPSTVSADPEVVATRGMLRMKLRNANPAAKVTGVDQLAGTSNYFIGNDPAKWRSNVPTYAKVKYEGIYSGIDLVYYGNQRQLEYDFIVAPGADPRRIAFEISGAQRIRKDEHGDLVLQMKTDEDEIRWHKPVVYQEKDGARQVIAAHYSITDKNRVGFELAKYDASRTLYVDPLIYSTYLGGGGDDGGSGIAVDSAGNAYVTGTTGSTNFPTVNPMQSANAGGNDVFVAKINPAGTTLVYSTYLGGSNNDAGYGIAVDSAGNAYVTGTTSSTNFPTMKPLQPNYGGGLSDAFVAKIDPGGSALVYSTYLGGGQEDQGIGIAVDSAGNGYLTGLTSSTNFPTVNPLQPANGGGQYNAFVSKINPAGSAFVYSTYLGGSGSFGETGYGIAVDSAGDAYVTGYTYSADFPTKNPLQPTLRGVNNAFVTRINSAGSAFIYSTYLGGGGDFGRGIAVDGTGDAYVTGNTPSPYFPTTPGAFQRYCSNSCFKGDAFVTKINPAGSALIYSTYLGGDGYDTGKGIAVDSAGNAYVTGYTQSTSFFPITLGAVQKGCKGGVYCYLGDAFVSKLDPAGSALAYSTYLGGSMYNLGNRIAVDSSGDAYVTGITESTNFPTKNPLQPANAGSTDAFVTKMDVRAVPIITLSSSLNPSVYGQAVTFTAVLTSTIGAPPDGETVTFMKGTKVMGTGALRGGSASFTTSTLTAATNYIKAVYGGDSTFIGSTSKTVKQVVNKATTSATLVSSLNPSSFGRSVTFTATVKSQYGATVKGSVTYYDGMTVLKTDVGLSGGVAKYTTSALTAGSHTITATYNGNVDFDSSSASLTQTVN